MAGKKISELPILPGSQLDQLTDSVVVVDASAQETKRMGIGDMVLGVMTPLVDSLDDIKQRIDETVPDLTPPPTPTGFEASAAISNFIVECDEQLYTMGHGHLRSRLYGTPEIAGEPLPTFSESYELAQFAGTVHAQPSNPATAWRLWLKWETKDGVLSVEPAPAGEPNGLYVKTGEDVAKLLEALNGELTESQLYQSLKSRIDLIDGPDTMIGSVAARLGQEATNRAAAILDEASNRITADSNLQSQIDLIVAGTTGDLSQLLAAIETEKTARIDGDAAEATSRETLATQMRGNYTGTDLDQITTGLLYSEKQARTDQDSALATSISNLQTSFQTDLATVNAAIAAEAITRSDSDTALATTITTLTATVDSNKTAIEAALLAEQTTRADADSAEATAREQLSARVSSAEEAIITNTSAITTESTVRAEADTTLATQITTLESTVTDNYTTLDADIQSEAATRASADSAIATKVDIVQAQAIVGSEAIPLKFWGFDSDLRGWTASFATATVSDGIVTFTPTATNASFNRSLSIMERFLGSAATSISARIRRISGTGTWEGNCYYSTAGHGISSSYRKQISQPINPDVWNVVEWDMSQLTAGGSDWKDNTIQSIRIDLVSDTASIWQIDWISVGTPTVTRLSAALQEEASVRATQTGDLFGQYTVKVDLNGYVSGFGLASTAVNGVPTSEFIITADKFAIAPVQTNHASSDGSPFFHRTTDTVINGVTVPAGTYMKAAYIHDATITKAKIADLAVDDAKIANLSAAKLTAGSLAVGQYIQSTGYIAGNTGWKINSDGNAEFSNAVIRGTVYASNGQFFGTVLGGAASTYSLGNGFYSGYDSNTYKWRVGSPTGARIQWNGLAVEVYDGNNKLTLASGDLSNTFISKSLFSVGGTNLLYNSGRFESLTDWFDNGGGLSLDTSVKYGGYNTLKIAGTAAGGIGSSVYRVESNEVYTFSALVKASEEISSSGYDSQLHIQNWTDDDITNVHQETGISSDNTITTSWKVVRQTFKTAPSATAGYVRVYFYPLAAGKQVWIAWAKLEKGNAATDWSPNPEETKNSNIKIESGALTGIGYGSGTQIDNSYTTIGQNLIANSDATSGSCWYTVYNPAGDKITLENLYAGDAESSWGWNTTNYVLIGNTTRNYVWRQTGILTGGDSVVAIDVSTSKSWNGNNGVPVIAGQKYMFSCYVTSHYCKTKLIMQFWDAAGNSTGQYSSVDYAAKNNLSNNLAIYHREVVTAVAPANSVSCTVAVRKYNGTSTNSWMWLAAPMLEAVNANVSTPSPYSPGSIGNVTQIGVTYFRILCAGNVATSTPSGTQGLYINGDHTYGSTRSYMMARIKRSTGKVIFYQTYDVYGNGSETSGRNAATLATDLNASGNDVVVVVWTFDEPQTNRLNASLVAAMYRCGASPAVFASPNFKYRSAYILVGIGGCGQGNGAELYQGSTDNDVNAWIDMSFQIVKGNLVGVSSTTTPKSLTDYGYTGDYDATNGATAGTNLRDSSGATVSDLGFLNKYSVTNQLAGDLSGNPYLTRVDPVNDRPDGVRATYGSAVATTISYADVARSQLKIYSASDTSLGACWPAFRVQQNMRYRVFIRWKVVGGATGAGGIYFRFLPKTTEIAQGKTHIGYSVGESLVDTDSNGGGSTCQVITDTNGVGAGSYYENASLTANDVWYETVLDYVPAATHKWASFCILNWTGLGAAQFIVDTCFIYQVTTAADGATVGASFGVNINGQITASTASTYIANLAVGTDQIADLAITNAKIANLSVTSAKIADASITAAKIGSIALVGTDNFSVKSATAGARMEMNSRVIKIFDANGTLRVKLGDLTQ